MKITAAEFIKSAPDLSHAPEACLPEIVFVGRSNVGKSSLINTLVNRKQLAKTSNTPGKTQLMNFYTVHHPSGGRGWVFVDLPGYGFAKVSKAEQQRWQTSFEAYLRERKTIARVIQLIDARHEPQKSDVQMHEWLMHYVLPTQIVLTKADKLSKNEAAKSLQRAAKSLNIPADRLILFSTTTKQGRDEVWRILSKVSGETGRDN